MLAKGKVVEFDEKDAFDFDEFSTLYRSTVGMGVSVDGGRMIQGIVLKEALDLRQYKTLAAQDLKQEFRTKEMLASMGIYALW